MVRSSRETVTVAATCYGVSIGVQCRRGDALAVSAHLPIGYTPVNLMEAEHRFTLDLQEQGDNLFSVRRESSVQTTPRPLKCALRALQKEIYTCVAEHAKDRVFIHAGVVAWKNRAVILSGFSHAGKSTLVWYLVKAGAVYYSDEYAVLDENGAVYPFALPISLRVAGGERRTIMPDRIGSAPLSPDLIAFARYRPGAKWRPQLLGPAQAVLQLIRHSVAIRSNPAFVLPVLKAASLQARSFAGTRDDAAQFSEWLSTID